MASRDTPEPSIQNATVSSPLSTPPMFVHSSPAQGADGNNLMRAVDTPTEASSSPTGVSLDVVKKRKRGLGKEARYSDDEHEEDIAPKKRVRGKTAVRGKSKKGIDSRIIPRTFEECEDIDKKLISMRDSGKGWQDIRRMWKEETGEDAGKSTLPNRYMRLKVNFTVINDKDNALLLKCHREVEEAFEKERWSLISKAMTREGSEVYVPEVLQRQFKKLMHQGANLRAGRPLNDGVEEER